jgi:pimeloyl-ACP methyl ester carboxylesterase
MEYSSIVFVGGFGASVKYSEKMCSELQRITSRKVYNLSLHHGKTLEEECLLVIEHLKDNDSAFSVQTYTFMGFSTGCLIAARLSEMTPTSQLILINPAELITRMNLNILEALIDPSELPSHRNLSTFLPMLRRSG